MNDDAASSPSDALGATPDSAPNGGGRLHPMEWAVDAKATDAIWQETQAKVRRRRSRRLRVTAASCAIFALSVVGLFRFFPVGRETSDGSAGDSIVISRATVVEPERRVLADGSIVELKPGAELRVAYVAAVRRVSLVKGEAFFQVAKDARRPFVVQAGGVEVRAVGTAFAVQLESRHVDVLVIEGRVAVERSPSEADYASGAAPAKAMVLAMVDAGRRTVVERDAPLSPRLSDSPVVETVTGAAIDERLGWRAPRLDFTSTRLADALPLINRYSRVQVVLGEPSIGEVRLSGILRADNFETLLRLVETEHGIRGEWRGTSEIVLRRGR